MIFGNTQLRQESTYLRIIISLPQLIDPAGTYSERFCSKEDILHGTGTIHSCPPLRRFIGYDDKRRRMIITAIGLAVSTLLQTGLFTLGKSAFDLLIQFFQHRGILNGCEMPRLIVHTTGRIGCRFQNSIQIFL